MSLVLRQATASDKEAITSAFLDAFHSDLLVKQIFPAASPKTVPHWENKVENDLKEPLSNWLVVTDPSSTSPEQVVAFARWEAPGSAIQDPSGPEVFPEGGDQDLGFRFSTAMMAARRRLMGKRKHWHLEFIGTRRDHKGKGAAGQLMRWAMQRADEEGVECFLESSPEGKGMYVRYGFVERDKVSVPSPEGDIVAALMVREPTR